MHNDLKKPKEKIVQLVEQGMLKEAKWLIQKYETEMSEDIEIYSIKGVIEIMEGQLVNAEKILMNGLEKEKENFDLLANIGYLYELKADDKTALKYYNDALSNAITQEQVENIREGIERIQMNVHKQNIKTENEKNILEYCDKSMNCKIIEYSKKKDFKSILKEIQLMVKNREYDEAISICNYWLNEIDEKTAIIYYMLGVAANGIKDFEGAIKYHRKALELDNTLADLALGKSNYRYTYEEENISCIGCGDESFEIINISNQSISEDNKELINPIRTWVRCQKCGLIYANPIPSEDKLNQYYSIIAKEKFGGIYGNIDDRFEALVSIANDRLEKIEKYAGCPKTILDIGTGIGIFTGIALDRGWDAEGLELTPEDCEYAKEKFGLNLLQENFYSFKENIKYDVVTLFEVIEHLRYPLEDLKQINKLIKDNGILVIATPIQDTLYGKKMKENNIFWNVVTHLSYFTKDVILEYLKEAGFAIVEINTSKEGKGRMEFYCRKIDE